MPIFEAVSRQDRSGLRVTGGARSSVIARRGLPVAARDRVAQREIGPRSHPGLDRPEPGRAHLHDTGNTAVALHITLILPRMISCSRMKVAVSRWLSFMPTICGIFTSASNALDRQRDVMQRRVVIDQDVELREQLRDLAEEPHRILDRRRKVIRHAEQHAVGRGIGDHAHLRHRLARVHRGDADEQRDALAHHVDGLARQRLELVGQQRMAFAEAAGGGDRRWRRRAPCGRRRCAGVRRSPYRSRAGRPPRPSRRPASSPSCRRGHAP